MKKIDWGVIVVDEGHRLKNSEAGLYGAMLKWKADMRVLLTGTPLQNNIQELFNLLQFLNPATDVQALQREFEAVEDAAELTNEDKVQKLHDLVRPHILRRLKKDVLKDLIPEKVRTICILTFVEY